MVHAGASREEADRAVSELQARGHKQLYWVATGVPVGRSSDRMRADA
jgi:hypothetical protein